MKIYHFLNARYGLENLKLRRLKVARLNELNDPFEFLAADLGNSKLRWALNATRERLANDKGILCFSKGWQNPVQWSHYADRHQGLCLGFEADERHLCPVSYAAKRESPDMTRLLSDRDYALGFMSRMLWTKFRHWSYEEEMRLFVQLDDTTEQNGLYFYNFTPELRLTDVIVGAQCDLSRSDIDHALGPLRDEVRCRKARLAFRTFHVVEQRKATLWS